MKKSKNVKTWNERCEEHPDHNGIVSSGMIHQRMNEEIDELRELVEELEAKIECSPEDHMLSGPVAWRYRNIGGRSVPPWVYTEVEPKNIDWIEYEPLYAAQKEING